MMSSYNQEQFDTLLKICEYLGTLSSDRKDALTESINEYLEFRKKTSSFLTKHFSDICTRNCYESKLSACCSREGIITFFADMFINILVSTKEEISRLKTVLEKGENEYKCVYLGNDGCLWKVKPIVCEMFLCETAEKKVFDENSDAFQTFENLKLEKKEFTWPDRPVIFDSIETLFMDAGISSPLMYMHNSPGLLMVKKRAGLK